MTSMMDALRLLGELPVLAFLAKATCILLLSFATLAIASRARAATRHAILVCTFAALLALPAVLWLSPGFTVSVPAPAASMGAVNTAPTSASARPVPADAPRTNAALRNISGAATTQTSIVTGERIAFLVVALWLMGALLTTAPFAIGMFQMRRLRRTSLPWTGNRALVAQVARQAGLQRPVALLTHENISTPLMSGAMSPAVLLPGGASSWSSNELQRALTHELEHVRRGDWLIHIVARGVCALYWFHPLVWMAWRRLALEAERACDDAVLQHADQSEYAEQLVSLARRISGSAPQPMIAMAARSDLSTRISAVLDTSQARGRLRSLPAIAALFVTAGVSTAMTPVHVVTIPVASTPAVTTVKSPVRVDSTEANTSVKTPARAGSLGVAETPVPAVSVVSTTEGTTLMPPDRIVPTTVPAPRVTRAFDCRSSLLRAVERGNLESLAAQIAQGAEVNCTEEGDGTPLIIAARRGHKEAVALLLASGADPNLASTGDGNPIIVAAQKGHIEVVQLLLDNRADPNIGVPGDGNALIAAAGAGNLEIAQLLLARGARIEDVVEGDENPLIHASEFGQISMVQFLIGRGANVNARVWVPPTDSRSAGEWRSPLSMARRGGHDALVTLLLNAGARQ